jgi:GntR family transcriptional regulator
MRFCVDPASRVPIFEQLVRQVRHAIAGGLLHEGDQLPTVRELAVTLLINPNTVQKAYAELASAGLITSRKGLGAFVQSVRPHLDAPERRRRLDAATEDYVTEGLLLGYSARELREGLSRRLSALGLEGDPDD